MKGLRGKRKTKTLVGIGGPRRIVQETTMKAKTLVMCLLCKHRFNSDDVTVLVDLVKRIRLTQTESSDIECTIRIHVCEACAEPIRQQRRDAINGLISLLAEQAVEDWMREAAKTNPPIDGASKPRQ